MSPDTYTLDVDADEAALVMEYRARKNAPPKPEAVKPKAEPKQQKTSPFWVAVLIVIVLMIVAWFGLNFAAAFNLFVPPGWRQQAQDAPTAEPLPTAAVSVRSAPVSAPQPRYEAQPVNAASVYPDTVPPYQQGAWTPGGPFDLDVAGRRYRALGQQGGATFAELDDGTRVWLGVPLAAPEAAPVNPLAQPDLVAENAGQAAGENAGAVDANGHVLPYDPSNPTAVATWQQALRNSGVDVDATQVACNADLAAGGAGCQP